MSDQFDASQKILLIGARKSVLSKLSSQLEKEGFQVHWTNKINEAIIQFGGAAYDVVAFGRGVDSINKEKIKTAFAGQNPRIVYINGLAPIIPLLIEQIKASISAKTNIETLLTNLNFTVNRQITIDFNLSRNCMIEIICYRLGLFFTTHQTIVYAGQTAKGNMSVSFSKKSGQNFVTVKVNHNEIYVKPV